MTSLRLSVGKRSMLPAHMYQRKWIISFNVGGWIHLPCAYFDCLSWRSFMRDMLIFSMSEGELREGLIGLVGHLVWRDRDWSGEVVVTGFKWRCLVWGFDISHFVHSVSMNSSCCTCPLLYCLDRTANSIQHGFLGYPPLYLPRLHKMSSLFNKERLVVYNWWSIPNSHAQGCAKSWWYGLDTLCCTRWPDQVVLFLVSVSFQRVILRLRRLPFRNLTRMFTLAIAVSCCYWQGQVSVTPWARAASKPLVVQKEQKRSPSPNDLLFAYRRP